MPIHRLASQHQAPDSKLVVTNNRSASSKYHSKVVYGWRRGWVVGRHPTLSLGSQNHPYG
eukprot:scaffold2727_cov275-Chaetoceros_neogracile.AAC.16